MTNSQYHLIPPGFSDEEWKFFESDGILFFEEALKETLSYELTITLNHVCQSIPSF